MKRRDPDSATAFVVLLVCLFLAFPGCATFRGKPGAPPPAPAEQPASPGGPAPSQQAPPPQPGARPGPPPAVRPSVSAPGAAPAAPGQPPAAETTYFVHTVKYWGESVSIIAGWYTGDIKNWETLAAANPTINPNRIVQGNRIRIPENIMIKREPMPKEWVDSFYPKAPAKPKAPAPAAPTEEEEPALFGPKK